MLSLGLLLPVLAVAQDGAKTPTAEAEPLDVDVTREVVLQGRLDPRFDPGFARYAYAHGARLGGISLIHLHDGFWLPPCAESGKLVVDTYEGAAYGPFVEVVPDDLFAVERTEPPLRYEGSYVTSHQLRAGDELLLHGQGFTDGMALHAGRVRMDVERVDESTARVRWRGRAWEPPTLRRDDGRLAVVPDHRGRPATMHRGLWAGCDP